MYVCAHTHTRAHTNKTDTAYISVITEQCGKWPVLNGEPLAFEYQSGMNANI